MAPRCTTSSCRSQVSNDNAPSKTIGNVNAPARNTKKVVAPFPLVEGMTQAMGNL